MKKTYIVIGLGRFGCAVAQRLYELGSEVLAIDLRPELVQRIESKVTCAAVCDVRDEDALRTLGVRNYDCAVIAIGGDLATSVVATLNLKELGVQSVVCKATDETQRRALEKIGADHVVVPERESGIKLAQSLTSSSILDFIELSPDCGIAELQTPPEWCGKSIRELDIRAKYGVNVIAVRENGKVHVTLDANRPLNEHITLVLLGENDRLARVNPLLAHTKKLLPSRAYREKSGEFAADGVKLLVEAARWYPGLHTVIAEEHVELCKLSDTVRVVRVPRDVMQSVSLMDAPQGAIFLCRLPERKPGTILPGTLLLDGIQDPGNLGTILRTADALEVPVVLLDGCADTYNPKTVRASMGAVFRTQPVSMTRQQAIAACWEAHIPLLATAMSADAVDLRQADLCNAAVVIGSEGQGISPELFAAAEQKIIIPMSPRCESLNAAVAATIVLWQMKR